MNSHRPSNEESFDEPLVSVGEQARRIDNKSPTRKFSAIPLPKTIDSEVSVKDRVNETEDRIKPTKSSKQKTVPTKELNSSSNLPSLKQPSFKPSQRFNKINADGQCKRHSFDSGFDSEPKDNDGSFIGQAAMKSMAKDLSDLLTGRKPSTSNIPQVIVPTSTTNEFPKASINDPSQLSLADRIKLINSKLFNN